jgi:prolyl-tRNA editing enzyme YbaK/EbsC (Cys-tRNA(Pro) deacylase)
MQTPGDQKGNVMNGAPKAPVRVQKAADALKLSITLREMEKPTRTVAEAAEACGCDPGAIVKSLVFMGRNTGHPYFLLVSGANRVDEGAVAEVVGEPIMRGDARFVRTVTGYAIGGVAPIGHVRNTIPYFDRDMLQYETVWAAAGTPNAVFAVAPAALRDATGATVIDMK